MRRVLYFEPLLGSDGDLPLESAFSVIGGIFIDFIANDLIHFELAEGFSVDALGQGKDNFLSFGSQHF